MLNDFSSLLRETKIGQKGFLKEDVINYVDELQSKIANLENEVNKYKNVLADNSRHNNNLIESLKSTINKLNFLLQQKNDELDILTKTIQSLEAKLKDSDIKLSKERQQYEESLNELKSSSMSENYNLKNEELLKQKDETIAQQNEEILLMKEKVQQVKQFLIEQQESIKMLNITIERLNKENNNSTQRIAELQDHINILESLIEQKDVEINTLKSIIDNEISSLKKLVY